MESKSDKKLTMNRWHKIRAVRRGNTAYVSIDTTTARSRRSITPSSILNVDDRVHLGGLEARKERYNNFVRSNAVDSVGAVTACNCGTFSLNMSH